MEDVVYFLPYRYGLVTEQKRGAYRYFVDLGEGMEVVGLRTAYMDEVCWLFLLFENWPSRSQDREVEVEKSKLLYGMSLGENLAIDDEGEGDDATGFGTRAVQVGERVSLAILGISVT
jgi:ATP-dependent DNA helicase 2 subunit 1